MPRFSTTIFDESGKPIGIACGSRRKNKPCSVCGTPDAPLLCDSPGCDKPVCHGCSVHPKRGVDICKPCNEMAANP